MTDKQVFTVTNNDRITNISNNISNIKSSLSENTKNVRNICVIAHVDHGKTSLIDNLISYNSIINPYSAGLVRYMDNTPEEQERCITMKASSISIIYNKNLNKSFIDNEITEKEKENVSNLLKKESFLINVIDSPGHIDFSSEIFTALKVCEGGLLIIDVIEGICSQTISVLKQAWKNRVKLILVFNKIDRLITEIKITSEEAYIHISQLQERINSIMSSYIDNDINELKEKNKAELEFLEKKNYYKNKYKDNKAELLKKRSSSINSWSNDINKEELINKLIEEKENEFYFSPEKGNVVFASAADSWGFSIDMFAEFYYTKLKVDKKELINNLWGNYYFNKKTKEFSSVPFNDNSKPLFVEFILDNIYKLYKLIEEKDTENIIKAAKVFNIDISKKDLTLINTNPRNITRTFMRQWLSIPITIFDKVIDKLPSPLEGFGLKIEKLLTDNEEVRSKLERIYLDNNNNDNKNILNNNICTNESELNKSNFNKENNLNYKLNRFNCITQFELKNKQAFALVLKLITIPVSNLPNSKEVSKYKSTILVNNDISKEYVVMPFVRLFSGTIESNKSYYIISSSIINSHKSYEINKLIFNELYTFKGQELEVVDKIYPGAIFSVWGIDSVINKSAIICETNDFPIFKSLFSTVSSLIKVSIAPEYSKDTLKLVNGLKVLQKSDPALNYYVNNSGEQILETAGEVHLERAIKDIEERLCKIKLIISPPIIDFREGLNNLIYNPNSITKNKFKNDKKKKKILNYEIKNKAELKNKKKYFIADEKENSDYTSSYYSTDSEADMVDADEGRNCSMPTAERTQFGFKKQEFKKGKFIVNDYQKRKENLDYYILRCLNAFENKQVNINGFYEAWTNNKYCCFGILAFGLNKDVIDLLESNKSLLSKIENNKNFYEDINSNNDNIIEESEDIFYKKLILKKKLIEELLKYNKKLAGLINNNLYHICGSNNKNMIFVKNLPKELSYFYEKEDDNEYSDSLLIKNDNDNVYSNLSLDKDKSTGKLDSNNVSDNYCTNIKKHLLDGISLDSFFNSIKLGWDLATGKIYIYISINIITIKRQWSIM